MKCFELSGSLLGGLAKHPMVGFFFSLKGFKRPALGIPIQAMSRYSHAFSLGSLAKKRKHETLGVLVSNLLGRLLQTSSKQLETNICSPFGPPNPHLKHKKRQGPFSAHHQLPPPKHSKTKTAKQTPNGRSQLPLRQELSSGLPRGRL